MGIGLPLPGVGEANWQIEFPEPVIPLVAKRMQAIHMEIRWTTTHVRRRRPVHDIQLTGGAVQLMHKYMNAMRDRAIGRTTVATLCLMFGVGFMYKIYYMDIWIYQSV